MDWKPDRPLQADLNIAADADVEPDRPQERSSAVGWRTQVALAIAVVVTGCANNIAKQIAARPLMQYSYMLGLATAVTYVPLYGGILVLLLKAGIVPKHQMQFVWERSPRGTYPCVMFFIVAALGDTLGDSIGMICTPYVSGPIHSLLSNCTPLFIAALSVSILRKRYSLAQCLGLLGVTSAVVIGVLPSFEHGTSSSTNPLFAIILGASCVFNAIAFVVKEMLFDRYASWLSQNQAEERGKGLHVFIVNTHAALFQLPFTLLIVPLNQALGQTHGENIFAYLREAFACVFSGSATTCGSTSEHGEWAGVCVVVYVIFNILWNIAVLMSVKYSGALTTFVALKAIFPVSTILFAYVDWPLLGQTPLNWLVWLSVVIMLPSIFLYQWASGFQKQREQQRPSRATCCWPLGAPAGGDGIRD